MNGGTILFRDGFPACFDLSNVGERIDPAIKAPKPMIGR
jgi:hypothetical protein